MIKFAKPTNLNGAELREELKAAGIVIDNSFGSVVDDGCGNLLLDISEDDETKAKVVVNSHNGTQIPKDPTLAEKLAALGVSIDDLKAALGV